MMDLSSLDIFRAVAEEASITRAATRLQRVQSNVTTRIRQLEDDLGTPLFLRDGKRMTLTDRGQVFLVYADKLLALADEARQAMHPGQPSGTLRLGSMESTAASRLPQPLADFHRRYPDVTLEVSTGNTQTLIDDVLARRLDCALVALPEQVVEEGLSALPVFEEELLLILPEAHPGIATFEEIQPRVLAGFARGCTYRAIAEDVMHASGGPLRVNEVGSYHAIIACVAAGACVGLVPRSVLPPQARVQAVPVMTLATQLVWRDGFSTAAFECLREQLITAGS